MRRIEQDKRANSPQARRPAGFGAGSAARDGVLTAFVLLVIWQLGVWIFKPYPFILPGPIDVFGTLFSQWQMLFYNGMITFVEICLGLLVGAVLGVATALLISASNLARRFVRPLVLASTALPVFAIAPLLVVWFGYGIASKVVMATLIIYFPIASALTDGLDRADRSLVDLGRIYGASPMQSLLRIRLPAALPSLASGLRVAATIAPIGAVVGEWVGSGAGLGYVMIQANARSQVDLVFAAVVILAVLAVLVRFLIDRTLDYFIHWVPKTVSVQT